MKLPVHQHSRVEHALESGYAWWAKHRSEQQAVRWYNGFMDALKSLGETHQQFPLAAESDLFPFEVREFHFGVGAKPTHRALYTIRPDMVFVFLIRHVSQRPVSVDDLD